MSQPEKLFLECACSQTGKTWIAALQRSYGMWTFAERYSKSQFESLQLKARQQADESRKQELIRHLAGLANGNPAPLPPPESVELTLGFRETEISSNEISEFGFQCPHCSEVRMLLCCKCHGISCKGNVDSANRTICAQCGTLLQFGAGSGSAVEFAITPIEASIEGHQRSLQRKDQTKLLRGN